MSKKRKTIAVEKVLEMANHLLRHSADSAVGGREGIQTFIENILFETGNYNGFRYLNKNDMAESNMGKSVGINIDAFDDYEKRFADTDKTRVEYH